MLALKIIAGVFLITGFGTIIGARNLVKKFKVDERVQANFENEMDEEETLQYKFNKALVNVKIIGMVITIPGIILTLIAFR